MTEDDKDAELRRLRSRVLELETLSSRMARELMERRAMVAQLRQLNDQAMDSVFLHDAEGVIVEANRRAAEELGYRYPDLLGMSLRDIEETLAEQSPEELARVWSRMELGVPTTWRGRAVTSDGTTFPVELRIGAFAVGERRMFVTVMRDTSDRETFDQALRESVQRFRFIFDGAPVGMVIASPEGVILRANAALEAMLHHGRGELRARALQALVHPGDRGRLTDEITALLSGGRARIRREALLRSKRGDAVWAQVAIFAEVDEEGALRQVIGVLEDITDRKRIEAERAALVARLETEVARSDAGLDEARAKVLVVEDDDAARAMTRRLLEHAGHEVVEARHGGEGLEVARATRPDLVVLDLLMPEMNGFAMLARLELDPELRETPVVILTGKALTAEEERLLTRHCLAIVKKGARVREELHRLVDALPRPRRRPEPRGSESPPA